MREWPPRRELGDAPANSEVFYRLLAELMEGCLRMALPESPDDPERYWPAVQIVGRGLALENASRDEALFRMLSRRLLPEGKE